MLLTHVDHLEQPGDGTHLPAQRLLTAARELMLELERNVEVIFDSVLAAPRHEDDQRDAGGHNFLDRILHQRLVDERKHFLRWGFGRGQESCAESGYG